jgi:NAD-dependent dihydropyrimidine dehydrogenase PreA subunit
MPGLRYLPNVTTLELDESKCNGCQLCIMVCPHEVFTIKDKRAKIVDKDACMECGACASNCPEDAITVDSGVGCAAAIIVGAIKGIEPTCECDTDNSSCC